MAQNQLVRIDFLLCVPPGYCTQHFKALSRGYFSTLGVAAGGCHSSHSRTSSRRLWLHGRSSLVETRGGPVRVHLTESWGLLGFLRKSRGLIFPVCHHRDEGLLRSRSWNQGRHSFVGVWLWVRVERQVSFDPQGTPLSGPSHHRHLSVSHGRVPSVAGGRFHGDQVETQGASCNFSSTERGGVLD